MPSKKQLRAIERQSQALELRKLGLSYQKIGDQMGMTRQGARQLVHRAYGHLLDKLRAEEVLAAVQLELERLDEWQVLVLRELRKGNVLPAIDRLVKISERRAKLLGLDAPVRHKAEVSGPGGEPVPVAAEVDLEQLSNEELMGLLERG